MKRVTQLSVHVNDEISDDILALCIEHGFTKFYADSVFNTVDSMPIDITDKDKMKSLSKLVSELFMLCISFELKVFNIEPQICH